MSQIIRDITEINRCGAQYRSGALAELDLKSCHASYLTEVCACPGISQDQLARRICVDKSNVARQVAVLEEKGFVRRVPCAADKRIMRLYPTEKAEALLPRITALLADWEDRLTAALSPAEKAQLESLLGRVKAQAVAWLEGC